jgi:hypothetical protein
MPPKTIIEFLPRKASLNPSPRRVKSLLAIVRFRRLPLRQHPTDHREIVWIDNSIWELEGKCFKWSPVQFSYQILVSVVKWIRPNRKPDKDLLERSFIRFHLERILR